METLENQLETLTKVTEINFYSGVLCYYHKVPQEIPGAYIFQRPFFRGLFVGGAYVEGKFGFQNQLELYWERDSCLKIDWASL